MTRNIITDKAYRYTRISKQAARKRFAANLPFQIVACKMRPGMPYAMDMLVDPEHIKAERDGAVDAFDTTVEDFCYYNANCHETGTYAAYYVRSAI